MSHTRESEWLTLTTVIPPLVKRLKTISNLILNVDVIETGMFDHYMIYGIREVNTTRLKSSKMQRLIETRNLKRYYKALFQEDLQEIDWDCLLAPLVGEPDMMVTTFQEIFELLLNVYAPLKVKRLRNDFAPCLTSAIRDLMTKRDRMKKAATNVKNY